MINGEIIWGDTDLTSTDVIYSIAAVENSVVIYGIPYEQPEHHKCQWCGSMKGNFKNCELCGGPD